MSQKIKHDDQMNDDNDSTINDDSKTNDGPQVIDIDEVSGGHGNIGCDGLWGDY